MLPPGSWATPPLSRFESLGPQRGPTWVLTCLTCLKPSTLAEGLAKDAQDDIPANLTSDMRIHTSPDSDITNPIRHIRTHPFQPRPAASFGGQEAPCAQAHIECIIDMPWGRSIVLRFTCKFALIAHGLLTCWPTVERSLLDLILRGNGIRDYLTMMEQVFCNF